jgi:hypothetical protein
MSIILTVLGVLAILGLTFLLTYHYKISLEEVTTHEDVKSVYQEYIINPFSLSTARLSVSNLYHRIFKRRREFPPLFEPRKPYVEKLQEH